MKIESMHIEENGVDVPGILLTPENSLGAILIIHGYGGCKEEILGLSNRIAETGFTVYTVDQRGHGENQYLLDNTIVNEIEMEIQFCRKFGKVVAIGHSSGGRLALTSSADFKIGISPALAVEYGTKTRELLDNLRQYRVHEKYPGVNYDILRYLPIWQSDYSNSSMIIYGSKDVPEIISQCKILLEQGNNIFEIKNALHNDIYLLEDTFSIIIKQLRVWFNL